MGVNMIHPCKDRGGYRKFGWFYYTYQLKHHINRKEFEKILDKYNNISETTWQSLSPVDQACFKKIKLFHCGHDYNTDADDSVKAILEGRVIFSDEVGGFGSYGGKGGVIIIEHKWNDLHFLALYGHLHRQKSVGSVVKEGDIIGSLIVYKQTSFRADHLHFCIIAGNIIPSGQWGYREDLTGFFDPLSFIKERT